MTGLRRATVPALLLACVLVLCLATACGPSFSPPEAGKVRLALATEPFSFDPLHADSTSNQVIQRQVLETLLEYHPTASPPSLQGLLAESWSVSENGATWEFTLREDALFHDPESPPLWSGATRRVEPRDVLESWLRHADARNQSHGWWAFEGLIEGLDAFREATSRGDEAAEAAWETARREGVDGFAILGPRHFRLALSRPELQFGNRAASPYFAVLPAESCSRAGDQFLNRPVGSGPFQVRQWIPRIRLILDATPQWRGQPDPSGGPSLPHAQEVDIRVVLEGSTRTLLFRNGEIDRLSPTQDSFDAFIVDGKLNPETAGRGVRLFQAESPDLTMVAFDMMDPVLGLVPGDLEGNASRLLLRQALALAFPYERWHNLIRNGTWARPATSFLPPSLVEAQGSPPFPWKGQDLQKASRFLAQAGHPNGEGLPRLRYELSGTDPVSRAQGDLFVDALAKIGIACDSIPNPWPEFVSKTRQGRAQIFARLWALDWPSAGNMLDLFHGPHSSPGVNRSRFQHEGYDRLMGNYRVEADPIERIRLAHSMLEILNQEIPAFPVDHRQGYLLVQPWLEGVVLHPFDPLPCKYLRVVPTP